ncbi:MAG TPA: hypothetical protein VEU96_04165 [Bryobacteraceae bacterium]|nr:hypothetical protein [Bryobacteraceae bacterium]
MRVVGIRPLLSLRYAALFVALSTAPAQTLGNCTVRTISGTVNTAAGDGGPATSALLNQPQGVAIGNGALYIADTQNHKIRLVSADGTISTLAGTGVIGYSGDGGPAASAQLGNPLSPAIGPDGSVYFIDFSSRTVRHILPDSTIESVTGTGLPGYSGDGGPAGSAGLLYPIAIAFDSAGDLFIGDASVVRRVDASTGIIQTIAGKSIDPAISTDFAADGQPATSVHLARIAGMAIDSSGNVFLATSDALAKITPDGVFHLLAGAPPSGTNFIVPGGRAFGTQVRPASVAVDDQGNIFFGYSGVWEIGLDGRFRFVADSLAPNSLTWSGGTLLGTELGYVLSFTQGNVQLVAGANPRSFFTLGGGNALAVDASGTVYSADTIGNRVIARAADGTITTIAGNGQSSYFTSDPSNGDGGPATAAAVSPTGLAIDSSGNLFIADTSASRVKRVDSSGIITTYAGTGNNRGLQGDGIPATNIGMSPAAIALDSQRNLYIADQFGSAIWKVTPDGIAHSFVNVRFVGHTLMAVDSNDQLVVSVDGKVYHAAADQGLTEWPDASLVSSSVFSLVSMTIDAQNNFYAGGSTGILRRLSPDGSIATFFRSEVPGMTPADGLSLQSVNSWLYAVTTDLAGNVYSSDGRVRVIPAGCQPGIYPVLAIVGVAADPKAVFGSIPAGSLVSIIGADLHFSDPANIGWNSSDPLPTIIAGTRVLLDGQPAGLVSVSGTRIDFVAPYNRLWSRLVVETNGIEGEPWSPRVLSPTTPFPPIFSVDGTGAGQAVAINQDGTPNSTANPAQRGSVVALYITGAGQLVSGEESGFMATGEVRPVKAFGFSIGGRFVAVQSATTVPGLLNSIVVAKVQIPSDLISSTLSAVPIYAGFISQATTIAVQ